MAIKVSAINNMTSAKDSAILAFASDFLNAEGVPFLSANDLKVTEQSPNAMAIDVEKGYIYVQNDAWAQGSNQPKYYRVEIDIKTGKSLTPNASANDWIVALCIKVDVGTLTPGASGELAGTIEAIYGTPAASPTPPAIPNHHAVIAYIQYNSSHVVITNARITDMRAQSRLNNSLYDEPALENNKSYRSKDSGGTVRNLLKLNASNILEVIGAGIAGILVNLNNVFLTQKDSGGTARNIAGIDSSNNLFLGDSNLNENSIRTRAKFKATRATSHTMVKNAATKVQYNTESYDVGGDYDNATNYRFTAPITGYYSIIGCFRLDSLSAGKVSIISLRKNGSNLCENLIYSSGSSPCQSISTIELLTAGDYIEVFGFHDDTVDRGLNTTAVNNYFTAHLISVD